MNLHKVPLPRYVEIETSRYCNRSCDWCPNGSSTGRNYQELMKWDLLLKILSDLSDISYEGWLALHNYNEPLANPRLLEEIEVSLNYLPKSKISIFTNGDFLSLDKLTQLVDSKVSYIRVTLYPNPSELGNSISEARILKWLHTKKLDTLISSIYEIKKVRQGLALITSICNSHIEVINPNINTYNWRGGTTKKITGTIRDRPCYMTLHSASVDFRGLMKMCCNVYPDIAAHSQYIVGDLSTESFLNLWLSQKMQEYRDVHINQKWEKSSICAMCSQELPVSQVKGIISES
jgi:hypothetical protein